MPANKLQKPRASKLKATETQCDASQKKTRNSFTRITLEQSFACRSNLSFAGLVALARSPNPIPSRTRPLNSSAPMVLCLKTWESRSLPGLQKTDKNPSQQPKHTTQKHTAQTTKSLARQCRCQTPDAGWSSPVARQAHNLKVTGSNPVPATTFTERNIVLSNAAPPRAAFAFGARRRPSPPQPSPRSRPPTRPRSRRPRAG